MVDLKEEQRYEQLRRLGQELHIPIPEAFWELEVRDKHGRLIQRHRQRSHSWTRNAYNALFSNMAWKNLNDTTFEAGKLSLKNTGGTVRNGNYPTANNSDVDGTGYGYRAPAGDDTKGILIGSGTNVEDFEDYVLQTQIADGTGAGELSHVMSDPHSITWTPATKVLKNELVRYFNNNSGGDVSVNEVALVPRIYYPSVGYYLFSRDKLASTVTVPDTGQLKVTYTVQLTFPE